MLNGDCDQLTAADSNAAGEGRKKRTHYRQVKVDAFIIIAYVPYSGGRSMHECVKVRTNTEAVKHDSIQCQVT